jgi:outer membrane protein assembly factor BamD
MRLHFSQGVLTLGLSVFLAGCSLNGDAVNPDYASDAQTNLQRGNEAFSSKNWEEAAKYYDYVHSKYPYLEASKEAELKLADIDFAKESWEGARDRYQSFVKLHPTHPKVDYAAYQAAMTHHEAIPDDYFFMPPSYEKDQNDVQGAVRALSEFVRQYPSSEYLPKAQKLLDQTRKRLAQHEMYVASFYKRRDRWKAVAWRLEGVAERYPGVGYDEEALMGLHEAYKKLNDPEKAKDALQRLITRMPGTPAAEKAQRLLGS